MKKVFVLILTVIIPLLVFCVDTKLIIQNAGGAEWFSFSPDGKLMATAGPGGTVKLWNSDGILLRSFQAHDGKAEKVLFSVDGKQLFTLGEEFAIKQWTLDGVYIRSYGGETSEIRAFYDMAVSPDGRFIASADGSDGIVIWRTDGTFYKDIKAPQLAERQNEYATIIMHSMVFAPDSTRIIAGGGYDFYPDPTNYSVKKIIGKMYTFTMDGTVEKTFNASGNVHFIALDPSGTYILTLLQCTPKNPDDVWDTMITGWRIDGKKTSDFPDLYNTVTKVFWAPAGKTFFAFTEYNLPSVSEWDIFGNQKREPVSLNISSALFFQAPFGFVGKLSLENKSYTALFEYDGKLKPFKELPTGSQDIVYLKNGGSLFVGAGWYQSTVIMDLSSGDVRANNAIDWPFSVSKDGNVIAGTYNETDESQSYTSQTIRILNRDGSIVRTFKDDITSVQSIAVSPDGSLVAASCTIGDYENPTLKLKIWKITGELIRDIPISGTQVGTVEFSPDGKTILCISGAEEKKEEETALVTTVKLFSLNGALIRKFGTMVSTGLADARFDPTGTKVILWAYFGCELWNINGQLQKKYDMAQTEEDGIYRFVNYCAFTPDGKKFITAHRGNTLNIWSLDGQLDKTLHGHSADVNTVQVTADGKFAVSASADGTFRIWNIKQGNSITVIPFNASKLFSYDNDINDYVYTVSKHRTSDWFICDDAGYFDCSNGGREFVKFVRGFETFEPDQFWQQFFTPGMLYEFVTGKKPVSSQTVGDVSGKAPVLKIVDPSNDFVSQQSSVSISIEAKPGSNGIEPVFLYHNGKAINEKTRGISVRKEKDGIQFTVELVDGQNIFVAAAYDKDGNVEGRSDPCTVFYTPKMVEKPSMYIIAVGVSNYKDSNIRLRSPKDDAIAIAENFKKIASGIYGTVETVVLTDAQATIKSIMKALNDVVARAKAPDTVILYFAGHGITVNDKYYFLPYEADITNVENTSITTDDLSGFIQGIAAKKIALLMDTCQSGSAVRDLGVVAMTRSVEERRLVATLAKDQGIAVFSASSESQAAYEINELGHGIFTWCVIDALTLRQKDISQNGVITIGGLLDYVSRATRDVAFKYLKTDQSPVMYNFGDNFSLGVTGK